MLQLLSLAGDGHPNWPPPFARQTKTPDLTEARGANRARSRSAFATAHPRATRNSTVIWNLV